MENVSIEKVGTNDVARLVKIARDTFQQAFSERNDEQNMQQYLNEAFTETKLLSEIKNEHSEFYFAIINGKVSGYLKLNTGAAQTELKDQHTLEIERVYVLPEYHGKKVGQALIDHAIKIAKNMNADFAWLGVWEHNERAIAFYSKNGFIAFDKHKFMVGEDEQTDLMMKKNLDA